VTSQSRESGASDEINVIGMTVEEATDRLDKFLDDAALAHKGESELFMDTERGRSAKALARSSLRTRWLRNIRLRPKSMAEGHHHRRAAKIEKGNQKIEIRRHSNMRLPRFSRTALLYSPRLEANSQ